MSAGIKYAALTLIGGAFLLIGIMGPIGLYLSYEAFNSRPEWSITGYIFWKMTVSALVMCGMLISSFWIFKKATSFGRVHQTEVAQRDAARAHAKQARESAASEAQAAREATTI